MNYRNQSANCGCNSPMQRSNMMPSQSMPYTMMGNTMVRDNDACSVVIVNEEKDCLADLPLAMAYVPWQRFENLFNETDALRCGTIFKDLVFEFCKRRCN